MDYYKYLMRKIGEIVSGNNYDYILYPFGERGAMVKGILNTIYDTDERAIIDNGLCNTHKRIKNLEYLRQIETENCKVLITSDRIEIYEEIREQLYTVIEKGKCIELLPVPEPIEVKRCVSVLMDKMKREGITYHPAKTKSDFYLPLLPGDLIQRTILLSDDYFERGRLDGVFKAYKNGIIGRKISEGQGVVLDIGANIGNHTLYFCNEYHAKKVYCFEPVAETFAMLRENIKLNHLEERVVLNQFGLGEKDSRGSVNYYNLNNIGGTSLRQDERGDLVIKSLDGIGIDEPVVLVKIDVEGMERAVLKGGMDLLKKNRPFIMVESFEDVFPETREILYGIGYKYEKLGVADWLFYPDENL